MISQSIGYLRESDEWVKTVVLGGLFVLLSALVVPAILVSGYLVRVLRATMHDDDTPPTFDEWGDLFGDGLRAFAIAVVYGIVPAILAVALAVSAAAAAGVGGRTGAAVGGMVILVGGFVTLVLGLLAAYVVPAAVANYAERDTLGAGFAFGDLRPVLTSARYAGAWARGFLVVVVAGIVGGLFNVVPILGAVVAAVVSFYAVVAAYYLVGHAFGDLHDLTVHEGEETPDERPAV
ncbi:MAG: DUF4013 domain-containing protein [Haloplanus sp.]